MKIAGHEAGASLVEFAVSASVLFSILFGIFYMCTAVFSYNYAVQTARSATRYAIVRGSSCIGFSDCNITAAGINSYVESHGLAGMTTIDPKTGKLDITWYQADNSSGTEVWTACAGQCNAPGNAVSVKVNFATPMTVPFVPLGALHLSSTSQMIISQ